MAQFFKDRFYLESVPSQFLFVLSFSLTEGLLIFLLLAALNPNSLGNLYPLVFNFFIPQSVFTGLVAPILLFIFNQGYLLLFRQPGMETKGRG